MFDYVFTTADLITMAAIGVLVIAIIIAWPKSDDLLGPPVIEKTLILGDNAVRRCWIPDKQIHVITVILRRPGDKTFIWTGSLVNVIETDLSSWRGRVLEALRDGDDQVTLTIQHAEFRNV